MGETWKEIKDYEGMYRVSNLGRIKSLSRYRKNGTSGYIQKGKILSPAKDKDGYLFIHLYNNSKRKTYRVHRLVAETFIPNPDNKPQINHIDGDKTNNTANNLEWATAKENVNHAWENGLAKPQKGEEHYLYGKHHTKETRKKMSKARMGANNHFYGKHHTKEIRLYLSMINRGKNTGKDNPMYGKTGAESPKSKKVICITTGEKFDSIIEASHKHNIGRTSISHCCRKKQKTAGKLPDGTRLEWEYL